MRKETSGFSEVSVSIRPEQEATLTTFGSTLAESGRGSVALNSSIIRDPTEHWVQPMRVTFPVVATTAQRGLAKTEVFGSTAGPASTRPGKLATRAIFGSTARANGSVSRVRWYRARNHALVR